MQQLSDIHKLVNEACGFSVDQADSILLGQAIPADQFAIVQEVMTKHVQWVDERLDQFKMLKEFRWELFKQRGFTYTEYLELFDTKKAVDVRRPICRILGLIDEGLRAEFIRYNQANEAHYMKNLYETGASIAIHFFSPMPAHLSAGKLKRHCYLAAQNGAGKTEMLKLMFYALQKQSHKKRQHALVLLDPHGDIAFETLAFHLNKDSDRVLFIDPQFAPGHTPVLNPLHISKTDLPSIDIYAQTLTNAFQELWENAELTLQMTSILIPCIATLLLRKGSTLEDLQRFMQDDEELIALGKQSPFPAHRKFFETAFEAKSYEYTKSGIYTRIQSLLNQSAFYRMTCGGTNTIDLEQAIDDGKVIIFRFTKSHGVDASVAMNKFVIARLLSLVLQRASKEKQFRKPLYLFIDEFQNYISPSITTIVEESRKFGLHLVISHQNLAQIKDPNFRRSILSNTHVKIIGMNGFKDLKDYSQELNIKVDELQKLPNYHFYARTGNNNAYLFKSNPLLIDQKPPFYLAKDELEQLKKKILLRDYIPEAPPAPPQNQEKKTNETTPRMVSQKDEKKREPIQGFEKKKVENSGKRKGFTSTPKKPLKPKFDY